MRKIVLNVLGGILIFFGLISVVVGFLGANGETKNGGTIGAGVAFVAVGVIIVVLNCLTKAKKGNQIDLAVSRYKSGACPYCGEPLRNVGKNQFGAEVFKCTKQHLHFWLRRDEFFTLVTDEEGKKKLISHDYFPHTWWYKLERDEDGDKRGIVPAADSEKLERAFKFLEEENHFGYGENTPEFQQAVKDAKNLDRLICPICEKAIKAETKTESYRETSKNFTPAFISSLGGSVIIESDNYTGKVNEYSHTEIGCPSKCHCKVGNRVRIARAYALTEKRQWKINSMLKAENYKVVEEDPK